MQMFVRTSVRVITVALLAAPLGVAGAQPPVEVHVEENLLIPMRDGVRLAADVYRPIRDGKPVEEPLPLLLHRTPYDKKARGRVEEANYYARHGYIAVVQDVRGRYASEGTFTKYIGEGQDGYDTIEHLARLPYTNGHVGMWGTSYAAHVQANAAKLRPPHLATIVLNMGGIENGWDHKVRNNGAFENQQLTWAFRNLATETEDPVVRERLARERIEDWLLAAPLRKGLNPLSIAPNFEDYVLEMMTHGDYDDDYFKHLDVNWTEHYDATADIPMMLVSGWYDSYAGGTVRNYVELSKRLDSPVHLMMGPWTHGRNTRSYAGEVEFGEAAALEDFYRELHLRWFDRFLKGNGQAFEGAPVRIFVMGTGDGSKDDNGRLVHGGYWLDSASWPPPDTELTQLFFHEDGTLRRDQPQATLSSTTYTYDPEDPVPTIGGAFSSTGPVFEPGAYDQREREDFFGSRPPYLPLAARHDVVVFQTEPLEEPVEIIGPITVRMFVSSTTVDTDFTVKLIDVYPASEDFPSGFAMNVTDGVLRARYRNTATRQELMTPGETYEITIEPFPVANVFKKGHRIRLDVSSSNFPRFDVNPNTGEPLGRNRRQVKADNTIHHDARHASQVTFHVSTAKQ
jgi:putative CocE/NonD family hydrolase